jgi:hypothetical protein
MPLQGSALRHRVRNGACLFRVGQRQPGCPSLRQIAVGQIERPNSCQSQRAVPGHNLSARCGSFASACRIVRQPELTATRESTSVRLQRGAGVLPAWQRGSERHDLDGASQTVCYDKTGRFAASVRHRTDVYVCRVHDCGSQVAPVAIATTPTALDIPAAHPDARSKSLPAPDAEARRARHRKHTDER